MLAVNETVRVEVDIWQVNVADGDCGTDVVLAVVDVVVVAVETGGTVPSEGVGRQVCTRKP